MSEVEVDVGHNGPTAEQIRKYADELDTATQRKDAAVAAMREVRKRAKEVGITPKHLAKALQLKQMSDEIRKEEQQELATICDAMGVELYFQPSLFDDA